MISVLRVLWLVVATALPVWTGYAFAARNYRDRGVFDRWLVALMSAIALVVVTFLVADLVRPISAVSLFLIQATLSALVAVWLKRHGTSLADVWALLRADLSAPKRWFAETRATKEPLAVLVVPASLIALWCVVMVLAFRSWGWDVLMFHTTITDTIVQDGSLAFMDTGFHQARGYPRNVHLLAAWNVFFLGDTSLDDAPQLPFGVLGALVCAAWARRLGTSRVVATGLGAAWVCFSPVFIQLPSAHVDVACGALLGAGAYFSAFDVERRDRWASALAFGLYLGTKHTGLFHLALYAPVLAIRGLVELRRSSSRARLFLDQLASVGLILLVGGHKYLQNALVKGNPAWPFIVTIPGVGPLPGENDASTQYGGPPGGRAAFFGIPGEWERFVFQLTEWNKAVYWPDLRDGYFGIAFTCLALPALVIGLVALWRRPTRWSIAALWFLALAAVAVPSAFWPRYSMGASIAGVAAIGLVWALLPLRAGRLVLSLATVALFSLSVFFCVRELTTNVNYRWPALLRPALGWTTEERATAQIAPWNWPQEQLRLMNERFAAGDVVTWDDTVSFPGELFSWDLRTTVVYVRSKPDLDTLVERVKAKHPRFSVVAAGGPDGRLEAAGAKRVIPLSLGELWLMEWPR